jgi:hypothetical protein
MRKGMSCRKRLIHSLSLTPIQDTCLMMEACRTQSRCHGGGSWTRIPQLETCCRLCRRKSPQQHSGTTGLQRQLRLALGAEREALLPSWRHGAWDTPRCPGLGPVESSAAELVDRLSCIETAGASALDPEDSTGSELGSWVCAARAVARSRADPRGGNFGDHTDDPCTVLCPSGLLCIRVNHAGARLLRAEKFVW